MINLLQPRADPISKQSENALATTDKLLVAVAKLRSENNFLRRRNKLQPDTRLLQQAKAGATLLALWHCTGYRTGRQSCLSYGMPERTWWLARALCIVARIHDGTKFVTDDPNTIEPALSIALAKCEEQIERLIDRIPISRRPRPRKQRHFEFGKPK